MAFQMKSGKIPVRFLAREDCFRLLRDPRGRRLLTAPRALGKEHADAFLRGWAEAEALPLREADGGRLLVSSGARAENIVLSGDNETYMEGELNVSGGGMASGIMVSSGGYLACWRDGVVNDIVIMEGGQAYLYGSGSKAQVSGGLLGVQAGGAITGATVAAGGSMWTVNSAGLGSALDTEIQSGGSVYNAGYMSNTMIMGGGTMTCANGFAELTEVQSGGVIEVSDGTMRGVTVQSGGVLAPDEYCYGGTFTGHVTVLEGATVSMAANQTINFDISGLPDPDTDYIPLVVGYSFIEGTPALTLTVSEEGQAAGKYLLANGLTAFDRGITFGEYTLTVGGEPVSDLQSYPKVTLMLLH